jgi:hypothetical protein
VVRSEDEIRKYDIFKLTVGILLLGCAAISYVKESKAEDQKKLRVGLSIRTPIDEIIQTENVEFSGDAPGSKVYINAGRKVIGESKVNDRLEWKVMVKARDLMDQDITIIARDADMKVLAEKTFHYTIEDDIRQKIKAEGGVNDIPVEITSPINDQTVGSGILGVFGTSMPNAKVKLYLNKEQIGTVTTDDKGEWQHSLKLMTPGTQTLSAVTTKTNKSTVVFSVSEDY